MLDILVNGWDFFSKKVYLLYAFLITLFYYAFTIIFSTYMQDAIVSISENMVNIQAIHIFSYFYKELLIIGLFALVGMILINYLCYVIARSNADKKVKSTGNGFGKIIVYSLISFFVFLVLSLIAAVFISFIESSLLLAILFIILLILLAIFIIAIALVFSFGVFYMGLNGTTITDSLKDAWTLIKKKFWLIIGFVILITIILGIIYFLIDCLYYVIFGYNEVASLIIRYVLLFLFLMYTTNSISLFVKKYS